MQKENKLGIIGIVISVIGIGIAILFFVLAYRIKSMSNLEIGIGFAIAGIFIVGGILILVFSFWKPSPNVLFKRLLSWWFWKRYSPNLSYIDAKIDSFDAHGFPGFSAKFSFTITNKRKPLKIDLSGVCLVVIQKGSNSISIGNSGLGTEDLLPNKSKTWKEIKAVTSPPQLVGIISNPPDISKPYDISIRGIYIIYNKFKKELSTLQNVKSPNVK